MARELTHKLELDPTFYHVGRIASLAVPAYNSLDLRLGWKFAKHFDLNLAAQNLTNSPHFEFISATSASPSMRIRRTASVRLTWLF